MVKGFGHIGGSAARHDPAKEHAGTHTQKGKCHHKVYTVETVSRVKQGRSASLETPTHPTPAARKKKKKDTSGWLKRLEKIT